MGQQNEEGSSESVSSGPRVLPRVVTVAGSRPPAASTAEDDAREGAFAIAAGDVVRTAENQDEGEAAESSTEEEMRGIQTNLKHWLK